MKSMTYTACLVLLVVVLVPVQIPSAQDVVLKPVPAGPPAGATGWNNRRDQALAQVCKEESALAPGAGDKTPHLGEAGPQTAMAKLIDLSCTRVQHLSFEPDGPMLKNADLVNAWIQSITDVGEVGTDFSGAAKAINITSDAVLLAVGAHSLLGIPIPDALAGAVLPTTVLLGALKLSQPDDMKCHEITDYDMGLVGLLRILYLYGPLTSGGGPSVSPITKGTLDYAIKHLLTQTGGVNEWRDHPHLCGIAIPVPETENHIWMTESSRYLSNQLIRAQLNPLKVPAIDATTKNRYVNDTNGMKSKLLEKLAAILSGDFHEYNARPYARMTAKALENLHDFSEHREVRRGAKMALDYISAKFATSSASSRRSVPYRRRTENENVTTFYAGNADEETWRFIQLSGAVNVLEHDLAGTLDDSAAGPMLVSSTSKYRVPTLIEDLIINPDDRGVFFQRYKHEAYELYYGRPTFLISAGGVFRPGWDSGFWGHVAIDAAISELVGNPVLGTLLGETAVQSLINGVAEGNAASALPTTLMPTAHGTDRSKTIRIEGAQDREKRNNTCVSPPGFFCGLNPVNPSEFKACTTNVGDYWSFIDLSNPKCEDDGIYVVYWHSSCDDSTCSEHAGGDSPSYGFFEVVEKTHDITLSKVINTTVANNSGVGRYPSRLSSTYTTFNGTSVNFTFDVAVDTWPISDPSVGAMTDWRLAQGDIVNNLYPGNNDWRKSCVEVDNFHLMKRRILDFHDSADPRWCEIDIKDPIKYGCAHEPCPPSDVD